MKVAEARRLARILISAADAADAKGLDTVDLTGKLQAADDAARAELESAITAADKKD